MEFTLDNDHEKIIQNQELYKLWSRTSDKSRFLSIKYFEAARKFIIDVGLTGPDNAFIGSTTVYVDAVTLLSYLRAVTNLTAYRIYPKSDNPKHNLQTDESIAIFGGGKIEGKPVARVFKSHWWTNSDNSYNENAFVWKCGHFHAKESSTGAFIQSDSNPISAHSIKVTRRQIAEMFTILEAAYLKTVMGE